MKFHLGCLLLGLSTFFINAHPLQFDSDVNLKRQPFKGEQSRSVATRAFLTSDGRHAGNNDGLPAPESNLALTTPKLLRRGQRWTEEDKARLIELREEGKSWKELMGFFPDRSWKALRSRYYLLTEDPSAPPKAKRKDWSPVEDKTLLRLFNDGLSWQQIAESLPGRTAEAAYGRYRRLSNDESQPPEIFQKQYSAEDDELILDLIKKGTPWAEITERFEGRNERSLKIRYRVLVEERTVRPWTSEDNDRLLTALEERRPLEEIARLLDRSENAVTVQERKLRLSGRIGQTILPAKNRFTDADYKLMGDLREQGWTWKKITNERFPGRSIGGVCKGYYKYLDKQNKNS